ncbi:MAG: bifunctional DNA-formamidopyrimidine glycosylase/DNA-(apurinic or apyrimidinic site) lyase [Gemmatimonadaceae bacterium]|nr:bifunctional DNA-formamidopyrimidine glycosylase/DNA-(apurinic or apyrimidinic site) lyase [Gemmatimonadaceae bacterium]
MPELPETETIARDLDAEVRGAIVTAVRVLKSDVLREVGAEAFASQLQGATLVRVWRRAKLIVLDVETAQGPHHLVVQPRFTGGLLLQEESAPVDSYVCLSLSITLANGTTQTSDAQRARALHYRDVRRLGTVALMSAARFADYADALGVEPLDARLGDAEFSALLRASRQPIKVALMDQRRLAGVGNIYANEALWKAGIDPSREARSITVSQASALLAALREVLTASIAARGTSFRDYRDARGERGRFVEQLAAYGRDGHPCQRCGRRLVGTHAIDGRGTVFCPTCQS